MVSPCISITCGRPCPTSLFLFTVLSQKAPIGSHLPPLLLNKLGFWETKCRDLEITSVPHPAMPPSATFLEKGKKNKNKHKLISHKVILL